MARPLRIIQPGGWYHVTARGNERRAIFRDDRDRRHLCELLAEWPARFGVKLHAFVLMDNHYHLLLQLTEPNLSRAVQWLNGAYCVWFNRRHRRCGHLLQGRFKAIIVEPLAWGLALSRYIHLNPVRVARLKLSKRDRQKSRSPGAEAPERALIEQRLKILRAYRWSSYRYYVGPSKPPPWLECAEALALGGGKTGERAKNYRACVENAIREGLAKSPWEELTEQVILGSAAFLEQLRKTIARAGGKLPAAARLKHAPLELAAVVSAVEQTTGRKWAELKEKHGDRGRDLVLYLLRQRGGMTLAQLARVADLSQPGIASMAVRRYQLELNRDPTERKKLKTVCDLLNVQL